MHGNGGGVCRNAWPAEFVLLLVFRIQIRHVAAALLKWMFNDASAP
jgi:hypothetical protein